MTNTKSKNTTHNNLITKSITNWPEYNKALIQRGDIGFLMEGALNNHVFAMPARNKQVGRPRHYSDDLILLILTIRELFGLPLRQTIGFTAWLFGSLSLAYLLPDYTTLSRRMQKLEVDFTSHLRKVEPIVLLVDSSGFKVFGEGEWKVRKHGYGYRRTWRETHIGVNYATRDIVALINTSAHTADITQTEPIVSECYKRGFTISSLIGDGAYDDHALYNFAHEHHFELIAPPHSNATERITYRKLDEYDTPGWERRNAVVRHIKEYGLDGWAADVDYHRRSLVETAFYRLKTLFGANLKSRTEKNQYIEQCIRAKLLNYFNSLGLPKYEYRYKGKTY